MLENVGYDKISDMTICIILEELILYTQEICSKYNIPMSEHKLNRPIWSSSLNKWINIENVLLPTHNNTPIILIPLYYAKPNLIYTYNRFYNHQMLPHYEKIALANPSEGLIRILKRGIVPSRTKIRNRYPCIKPNVINFIQEHPDEYQAYKEKQLLYVTYNNI